MAKKKPAKDAKGRGTPPWLPAQGRARGIGPGPSGLPTFSPSAGTMRTRGRAAPTRVRPAVVAPPAVRADSLLVVLWRNRWVMLICLLLAIDGGIAYLQNVTPLYTSTAKLYLDYAGIRLSSLYDPVGRPQTDKYLSTQVEIIKSRPVLGPVEEKLAPRALRTFAGAESPIACLQKNLLVEIGKKDEVISVSLTSPYPAEVAEIVRLVVDSYQAYRTEHGQQDSHKMLETLQTDLRRADEDLKAKQNELTAFRRDRMPLALGSDQGNGVTQRYLDLQTQYLQAQVHTADADGFRKAVRNRARNPIELRQYMQQRDNSGVFAATDQERQSLETQRLELERQKAAYSDLTPNVLKVKALFQQISQIDARLKQLEDLFVKSVLANAEQQYLDAKGKEDELARLCNEQKAQVKQMNVEIAQFQQLVSDVERAKTTYQTYEQKVRDFSAAAGDDGGQLRITELEPALAATVPSAPQPVRVMALALILGLLLGGGTAVTRDWLDQTLRSTEEISAVLHMPVLGIVPAMSRRKRMQERGRKILLQPDSYEAEAFRTIRTAVLFGAAPSGAKTLLITSPAAGEGKSTLVSNLAIALANAGQKTLILDADFRKPTQHSIFGLDPRERCLGEVFAGTMTLAAAVQPSGIERLHILTGGHRIANPAEVLNSAQFAHLLTCLTDVYDRIVVDAPPATVVTDAQILGALCDATVLVLKADRSMRAVAVRAVDALQSVGARLLGVVVNEVRQGGHRYGYYYHRYRKHYGSDSKCPGADQPQSGTAAAPLAVGAVAQDAQVLSVRPPSEGA
jgi:succinoglycan biosynthesis transport protein ExoP